MVNRPGLRGVAHQLEVLDPHVVDVALVVLVHLPGVVEAPVAQVVHRADDVVEGMLGQERSHLRHGVRAVVGLDAQEHVAGELRLESLYLGDVVGQVADSHGELGIGFGEQGQVVGDADAEEP